MPATGPLRQVARVKQAVCAIGFTDAPPEKFVQDARASSFEVVGSGFLIESRLVMTCAHVLTELTSWMGKKRLPETAAYLQFIIPRGGGGWEVTYRHFDVMGANPKLDIASVRARSAPAARHDPPPVSVIKASDQIEVGEEIGLVGFPHGSALLGKKRSLIRFGPLFQRGSVSALTPYDGNTPNEILLDLITAGAASGSPIFRIATGEVIGVLARGQEQRQATTSIAIPVVDTGRGIAVPFGEPKPRGT